jgi:hypothetical protein
LADPLHVRAQTRIIHPTQLQEEAVMPVRSVVLLGADPLAHSTAGSTCPTVRLI